MGAGKALVLTTHFQEFPGLLNIANMDPVEVWGQEVGTLSPLFPYMPPGFLPTSSTFVYLSHKDCHSDPHTAAVSVSYADG